MEAADAGVARSAGRDGHVLGRRGELLGLGSRVSRNGGGAETSESEDDDESADKVVLHDDSPWVC